MKSSTRYQWGLRLRLSLACGIFLLSLLPFLLALGPLQPGTGKMLPAAVSKWYVENVEPVQELRTMAKFPDTWEGRWYDLDKNYARFEKWFADNLGLRDLLIRTKNELDYRLFRSSSRVYFGKDNDIYGRHLVDYQLPGTENLLATPEGLEEVHNGVVRFSEELRAQGITVVLVTPMQKQYFEPGRLPFFAPRLTEPTHFMALYDRLKDDPRLHFIDVRAILKANQARFPIFYRQDFHWTDPAALEVAAATVDRIAELTGSSLRWSYPLEFEYKPFPGGDARFSARLLHQEQLPEPALKKTWGWADVHQVRPGDTKLKGIELESDILADRGLLPPTCMYGNSFGDGMIRAGIFDFFQRFTTFDRYRSPKDLPPLLDGRCQYLIVQILDIATPTWAAFKQ